MLKVYDLIIGNIDLLAKTSNCEVMFPDYSRNILRMSVLKIFQGYLRNERDAFNVMNIFLEVEKFKKMFCGLYRKNANIDSLL